MLSLFKTRTKVGLDVDFLSKLKHETPFFVFSKEKIIAQVKSFNKFFPNALIHYAIKANYEPEVLKIISSTGAGFEAASQYEINWLREVGVPANKIIYGTSIKPINHIKAAYNYGVRLFAFDSLPELDKIAAAAPGSKVYVRVLVNDAGSVFRFSEKFGTERDNIVPYLIRAKELGLIPYGISFHVGSQASNPKAWANAIRNLKRPLLALKKVGIKIEILNIGGGYPCSYASSETEITLKVIAENTLKEYRKLPYRPKLILEPGRGIIACTGVLVASIVGKVERMGSTWLFLDSGVYNGLFETMAYQGSTRYRITSLRPLYDSGEQMYALAGPTGDSPDVITHEALLPKELEVGDKLLIHDVGAYSLSVTSNFNGFPKPKAYFI
ncbi:MAG: type III PLP-dependent enzyme [Candidatus Doudnabacteria bacterium]|nr:type III PLP-dependent enzyme [Candidatus Doudnabacteria bacterium]